MKGECAICWGHDCLCEKPLCDSTIIGHRCYLEAGHDSDHEDAEIWWGDPVPGVQFTEPGNPFSPVWHRADNGYSVNLESE